MFPTTYDKGGYGSYIISEPLQTIRLCRVRENLLIYLEHENNDVTLCQHKNRNTDENIKEFYFFLSLISDCN